MLDGTIDQHIRRLVEIMNRLSLAKGFAGNPEVNF